MDDFLSARQTAAALGWSYSKLMGYLYAGKVRFTRKGYYYFIHQDEVTRLRGRAA